VNERIAAARIGGLAREIAPHRDRAQSFVQEHKARPTRLRDFDPLVFDLPAANVDKGHQRSSIIRVNSRNRCDQIPRPVQQIRLRAQGLVALEHDAPLTRITLRLAMLVTAA
jgi:hypothetical protein